MWRTKCHSDRFLGSFAKLRKAAISFVLNTWLHPPMNIGETLGIYELEIKHSKQFIASSIWEK